MITVYTAVFGNDNTLHTPICSSGNDVNWVVFSDEVIVVPDPWELRLVNLDWLGNPLLMEKRCKIMSHDILKSDGILIWVDADRLLLDNPAKFVEQVDDGRSIGVIGRSDDCLYEHLGDDGRLKQQVNLYKTRGYPAKYGISDTSILVRKPTNSVKYLEWFWWLHVQRFSNKDWVSFDFCIWDLGMGGDVVVLEGLRYLVQHRLPEL